MPRTVRTGYDNGMGSTRTVVIDPRFNGPPGSGNGGYACGTAAEQLGAVPAEVTLSTPPPTGVALDVVDVDGGIELRSGDVVVAQAGAWDGDVEVPAPPPPDALEAAAAALDLDDYDAIHPFPTCFVCGPRRAEGDGLRIFPGPLDDGQTVAWRWVPSPTTADDEGSVRVPITWAALDCLSGMAWMAATDGSGSGDAVLGRLAARIERRPHVGEATVVAGWRRAQDGRKLHSGSAVWAATGELLARAAATWIQLEPSQVEAFRAG